MGALGKNVPHYTGVLLRRRWLAQGSLGSKVCALCVLASPRELQQLEGTVQLNSLFLLLCPALGVSSRWECSTGSASSRTPGREKKPLPSAASPTAALG